MKKSGMSLVSIVLYVALFFVFSVFAIAMSSNMNYSALTQKGEIWINEEIAKLEFNIISSAKKSNDVDIISGKIVFSNEDEYRFDAETKIIYKNGGVLISDVEEFNILDIENIKNAPDKFNENIDDNIPNVLLKVKLKKYDVEKETEIVITVGDLDG